MAGMGLSIQQTSDEELKGIAESLFDRYTAIERQKAVLDAEIGRLEVQVEEVIAERESRGLPPFIGSAVS